MLASALVAGAMVAVSNESANADTTIDQNTVRVDANDTLSEIAEYHHTTVAQLVKDNHIANQNLIHVGDKLVVTPGAKATQPAQPSSQVASNNNQGQQVAQTTNVGNAVATTNNSSAANEIAQAESGGSYTVQNGRYYGRYQLDLAYLGGDLSPQHQEEVFQQYCNQRYGGVDQALAFRQSHGWY